MGPWIYKNPKDNKKKEQNSLPKTLLGVNRKICMRGIGEVCIPQLMAQHTLQLLVRCAITSAGYPTACIASSSLQVSLLPSKCVEAEKDV